MKPLNYDTIAPGYDHRYRANRFDGVRTTLAAFVGTEFPSDTLEIGCGTGHWLSFLETVGRLVTGIDPSNAMLAHARVQAARTLLIRGRAEVLPLCDESFDRAFCINALHHFQDPAAFVREARRVLRSGGGLLSIGLDPHVGTDKWWIYDYFPDALASDRARYAPTGLIRQQFRQAGFRSVTTAVVQHIPTELPFTSALEQGLLERGSTSQLLVIDDALWEAGLARLHDERPVLCADLRLYATIGWVPARSVSKEA